MRYPSLIAGLALFLSACASTGSSAGATSRDVITREQIATSGETTAFEAVRAIQPRWVRASLTVYLDGTLAAGGRETRGPEGANYLRSLPASSVVEIRFLDAQRASIKYGMGMGAVIEVITNQQ